MDAAASIWVVGWVLIKVEMKGLENFKGIIIKIHFQSRRFLKVSLIKRFIAVHFETERKLKLCQPLSGEIVFWKRLAHPLRRAEFACQRNWKQNSREFKDLVDHPNALFIEELKG